MFDLESKRPEEITINTKKTSVTFNMVEGEVDANLAVGKIDGPGEFEIGDVTVRGIATESGKTIYDVEVGECISELSEIVRRGWMIWEWRIFYVQARCGRCVR